MLKKADFDSIPPEDGDIGKQVPAEGKGGLGRMGIRNDSQFCFGLCGLKCW